MSTYANTVPVMERHRFDTRSLDRYLRLDRDLDRGSDDMDDASASNIHQLQLQAERLLDDNQDKLEAFCKLLAP